MAAPFRIWLQADHIPEMMDLDHIDVEPAADQRADFIAYVRPDALLMEGGQAMTPAAFIASRERLHMTRAAFAAALGIAPNTVTAYEKGRYPVPLTVRLAIAALLYGLPPA